MMKEKKMLPMENLQIFHLKIKNLKKIKRLKRLKKMPIIIKLWIVG